VAILFHLQVIEDASLADGEVLAYPQPLPKMVEFCSERMRLLVVWQNAMEVYSRAVAEQSRQVGTVSHAEYERLSRAAESARQDVQGAKRILEVHVSAHGCDGEGEALKSTGS
jgi:hypothetical protein